MNDMNSIESHESKKNIKWYTYVNSKLNTKLKRFMEEFKNSYVINGANASINDLFYLLNVNQEEAVKHYSDQDDKFIAWAEKEIEKGNQPWYDCSW